MINSESLPLIISIDIKNTGTREGSETAQLYLSWDDTCSVPMPVKQLKGFKKIRLMPNEKAVLEFVLTKEELSFYDTNAKEFVTESGLFTVRVGNSSDNLPLVGKFQYIK
jgi:beta-glucosidase